MSKKREEISLFKSALQRENTSRPPVWLMRQAGRYHGHYQALRQKFSFIELCKKPELACEVTLGPIRDFDFDAAILFSDLLFPLEAMGMGLTYEPGPRLDWHLTHQGDLKRLQSGKHLVEKLTFQARALELIRSKLDPEKGLLGFVGGPLTLFCYAVEGSHQGQLFSAREGLTDGRFLGFFEKLMDLLLENMVLQAESGADAVAILDTCAGEFPLPLLKNWVVPALEALLRRLRARLPGFPLVYYSKGTGPDYWEALRSLPIACLGIDWKQDLSQVLSQWSDTWAIQGNVDPSWLLLGPKELEKKLLLFFDSIKNLPPEMRRGWICGLGHGVLPKTPENNVRLFLKLQKEIFSESCVKPDGSQID